MTSTRRTLLIGSLALGAAGGGGYWFYRNRAADGGYSNAEPAHVKSPVFGDTRATKRFSVWGSYTCPFTAMLIPVLMQIVKDFPQKVSLEWRHMPTHPPDPALHVAGLGFETQHFWNFTSAVLAIVLAADGQYSGLTPEKLVELARAEGGTEKTLRAAYADKAKWAAVKEDFLAGKLLGVTKTPGLFYNGYFMTPAGIPRDMAAFDKSLRAMLKAG